MLYVLVRNFYAIYIRIVYRPRIYGRENIPGKKPFIICSNHLKWLDPLVIGMAVPTSYRIHYMAKKELFSNRFFSYLLRNVGAFPLDREKADYVAMKKAFQLIKEGQVLGLFPEGARSKSGELQKAQNGSALIAARSGVPILPVAIAGPYRPFKSIRVIIGRPFVLPPLVYQSKKEKKDRLNEMSALIMEQLRQLLAEKQEK